MIKRFEDEYPETKPLTTSLDSPSTNNDASLPKSIQTPDGGFDSVGSSSADASVLPTSSERTDSPGRVLSPHNSPEAAAAEAAEADALSLRLSRTGSNASLAARAITNEEGRMHRFSQSFQREILKQNHDRIGHPREPDASHLSAMRERLDALRGEDIRNRVESYGADRVLEEIGVSIAELQALEMEDPVEFEKFRSSHLAAEINKGRRAHGAESLVESKEQNRDWEGALAKGEGEGIVEDTE